MSVCKVLLSDFMFAVQHSLDLKTTQSWCEIEAQKRKR